MGRWKDLAQTLKEADDFAAACAAEAIGYCDPIEFLPAMGEDMEREELYHLVD